MAANDSRQPDESRQRTGTPWWHVALGALFVIAVTTGISYVLSEDPAERGEVTNIGDTRSDDFNRPRDDRGLGTGPIGTWTSERGVWSLQLGTAFISFPDKDRSLAVVDASAKAVRVAATVWGDEVCGIVARYERPDQYVALIRVAEFGVWNVVEVDAGDEVVLGKVPDLDTDGVGVSLSVDDDLVQAEVGLQRISVRYSVRSQGTSIGLVGQADTATSCSWDDVTVQTMK
ncbi:MAG: hypothetical protein ACOYMR_01015 [Ilumatobacteraceae bacterium]